MNDTNYLQSLGKEYLRNAAEIERLQQMQDGIKKTFQDAIDNGTLGACKGTVGAIKYSSRAGAARINSRKFEEAYPVNEYPDLYKHSIDNAAVKTYIAPNDLAEFQTVGKPTIVIDAAE